MSAGKPYESPTNILSLPEAPGKGNFDAGFAAVGVANESSRERYIHCIPEALSFASEQAGRDSYAASAC